MHGVGNEIQLLKILIMLFLQWAHPNRKWLLYCPHCTSWCVFAHDSFCLPMIVFFAHDSCFFLMIVEQKLYYVLLLLLFIWCCLIRRQKTLLIRDGKVLVHNHQKETNFCSLGIPILSAHWCFWSASSNLKFFHVTELENLQFAFWVFTIYSESKSVEIYGEGF